ncbi:MAG: OmpA family protein, partial [Cellvibrionaceae bacterium]|nr:OmpA family protein [Cellvibrionaceae bacterium]
ETERDAAIFAQALQAQIVQGEIEIETIGRKIVIRIREKGSFKSGSATLTEKYYQVLEEVAAVLAKQPGRVQVQGHTDNIPIKTRRFRSNWELSTARAVSVAHALMVGKKVKQSRFEVIGHADTRPLVDNSSRKNRATNRRVEIVINQGLDDDLNEEDKKLLQDQAGQDLLRDLKLEPPKYQFNLKPNEIF